MKMKRRVILVSILLVFTCWWALMPSAQAQDTQVISARAGLVSRAEGEAWYRRRGERETRQLRAGLRLSAGDVVWTGERGRVEWSLNPGSYLQVGARSRVLIYETNLDKMHFDIERGEAFALVSALDHVATLVLDTPPVLLNVVKSGRYRIRVRVNDETEAAVRSGELQFTNQEGKTVRITKRKRVRFAAAKGGDHGAWTRPHAFREK